MRLIRLEAHDFAQHADLDLDLSTVQEAAIVGENGVGKSRLMDAALWSMYGRAPRGTTDSLIRDDRLGMWVKTTWDREGAEVVVMRSRSVETKAGESSLALQVDGERASRHTIAETQAVIESLVGLSRDQLLAGPWMAQGESDALMQLRPADRTALAVTLFGLERIGPWYDRAREWLAAAEQELAVLDDRRQRLEEQIAGEIEARRALGEARADLAGTAALLDEVESRVAALTEEAQQLHEDAVRAEALTKEIAALNRAAEAHASAIDQANQSIGLIDATLAKQVPPEVDAPAVSLAELEANVTSWEAFSHDVATRSVKVQHLEAKIEDAKRHVAREHELCATCPYRTEIPDVPTLEAGLVAESTGLESARAGMDETAGAREALAGGKAAIAEWNASVSRRAELLATQEVARSRRTLLVGSVETSQEQQGKANGEAYRLNTERLRLVQTEDRAREVAADLQRQVAEKGAAMDRRDGSQRRVAIAEQAVEVIEAARAKIEEVDAFSAERRTHVDGLRIVVKMFHRNGLPTAILESGLPLIEGRANELLAKMPGDIAVRFRTQRQTKSGTWSDELDVEVTEAGRTREYDVMSGAERFRIDLALRVAIGTVLAHRSGTKFETLWLDEPFAAQDRRALEGVLESIAAVVGDFGLTLVVTHQPEVADRFPVKIEVTSSEVGLAEVNVG